MWGLFETPSAFIPQVVQSGIGQFPPIPFDSPLLPPPFSPLLFDCWFRAVLSVSPVLRLFKEPDVHPFGFEFNRGLVNAAVLFKSQLVMLGLYAC